MKSLIAITLVALAFGGFIDKNLNDYLKQNAPYEVYEIEENPFKDYTEEEILSLFQVPLDYPFGISGIEETVSNDIPESYDFRTQYPDCVQKIRNQASCGSCWAFSGSSALAERYCIASKGSINTVLSAEDSVACDKGNYGCNGGYLSKTWSYYKETGIVTEACYPYASGSGTTQKCRDEEVCDDGSEWKKYKVSDYNAYRGISAIQNEILNNGPVQTGFTVYRDFMSYKSGIYKYQSGSVLGGHAVVIVGWGVEDGVNYWIAQNSWGPNWGENGYFRIQFGQCGFDSNAYAGVPIV